MVRNYAGRLLGGSRACACCPPRLGTSIPDLRARGFAAARADAVAVIEDHVLGAA